jgi:hypothetical protein
MSKAPFHNPVQYLTAKHKKQSVSMVRAQTLELDYLGLGGGSTLSSSVNQLFEPRQVMYLYVPWYFHL